jgi:tetratricopeptide (TPR) repeat protein
MAYPGNPELSPQAQERVMTAFRQVVGKLQEGSREEALIGLEFVLRLDPAYAPARNLHRQLSSGAAEVDLNEIVAELQAPTTDAINSLLVEAVEDFNNRDFAAAREKVNQVLLDLPGHQEARQLLREIEGATKGDTQVSNFLDQAREALRRGDSQEAANFVMMAQALDPHHKGIAATIAEIEAAGGVSMSQAGFTPESAAEAATGFAPPADSAPAFGAAQSASEMFADTADHLSTPLPDDAEDDRGQPDFSFGGQEAAPAFDAPPAAPEPPPLEDEKPYYEETMSQVSELFQEAPGEFAAAATADTTSSGKLQKIRELLSRGGTAAAADDFASAIDAWSRVFLIDPDHEEAHDRIEHIRHAKEELERRIEPMLTDARDAHDGGNDETARDFVNRVLELSPNHVEARRLADALGSTQTSPRTGPAGMPDLEDDLFSDDFSATADFGADVSQPTTTLEGEWRTPKKPKRRLPWQWWAAIGGAGVLVIAFSLWVASNLMPEKAPPEKRIDVVNRVLVQAAELYNTKHVEEAIVLLEQNSKDDAFQVRIDKRLNEYRSKIATPVPTPVPEGLAACRSLLAEGRWMAAYERVKAELRLFPNDPGLEKVRLEILEVEPEAAVLQGAVADGDYRAAIAVCRDMLEKRPDDTEVIDFYERTLFNAGMAELRAFNLLQSESYLKELADRHPDDLEVQRVLEFVDTYKSRPVDMQLEIFVGSIPSR